MDFTSVILAAGQGARAGGYKPLWRLGTAAVIDRVIDTASSICKEVRVIGGYSFNDLKAHLESEYPNVTLLENPNWKEGMFSSVQTGLSDLSSPAFIHPADIPGPGPQVYRTLANAFESDTGEADVIRPVYKDRPGHPILLDTRAVGAVQNAPAQGTLRDVLRALRRVDVQVDDELILHDFDTLADFEKLKESLSYIE